MPALIEITGFTSVSHAGTALSRQRRSRSTPAVVVKEGGVSLVWDNALPVASPTRPLVTNYNATLLSSSGVVLGSAQVPADTYGYAIRNWSGALKS